MKFEVKIGDICKIDCDAIVVDIFEKEKKLPEVAAKVDVALGGAFSKMIAAGEIKGKLNEVHVIHTLGKMPARMVIVAGAGKKEEFNANKIRSLMGEVVRVLSKHNCQSVATILHGVGQEGIDAAESAQVITEGVLLGSYKFKKHFTKNDENHGLDKFTLMINQKTQVESARDGMQKGVIVAEATMHARDMVNEPANHMTPTHLAKIAERIAEENGLALTVLDKKDMVKERMGALLGVAQGTIEPPKFIILSYKGASLGSKTIGLIGKGLTFDSGGISLKSQEYMSDMKGDMAGGAVVMAAICAIARLKLKVNVTAIIPATENLPGGRAMKPSDVLKAANGKTIEVVNTDAEGRLILADAISYAVKKGLSPLVDVATLTGACHVALGDLYAGVFSDDNELANRLVNSGDKAGEHLWQLPLPDDYAELNKSDVADIKNSGGRYGGAITAALFLKEFVGKTSWAHIDIAGPFMSEKVRGVLVKGATGFGVRTLVNFVESYCKK